MNKQIEEMAKDVMGGCDECSKCELSFGCMAHDYARRFYNLGYRKAEDVARDVIMDVIEILNSEYVKCNKWEAYPILAITQKIADLKKKYESEGADDDCN